MADEIKVAVIETEKIHISMVEPQPINIKINAVEVGLDDSINALLALFTPPGGEYRITKMYVSKEPHHKLKVEYEIPQEVQQMAIQSMQLDPNAASYTDDEIVGKVNAATDKVDADQLEDGTTNKVFTTDDETKLTGIEESATVDQTGDEIVTAVNSGTTAITREDALSQDDLNIVKTAPTTGEFKVKNIHRQTDGKMDIEYDDVAV